MMRRLILATIFSTLMLLASRASAELRPGATLISLDGAFVSMVTQPAAQTSYGGGGTLSYEKLSSNANWTAGFRLHYFKVQEDYTGPEQQKVHGKYDNILLQLMGRYFLELHPRIKPYAGVGIGFKLSTYTITTDGVPFEDNESNFSLSLPMGLDFYLTQGIFVDLNYTFNFLATTSFLRHDIENCFQAGIGFHFGGHKPVAEQPEGEGEAPQNQPAPTPPPGGGGHGFSLN